MMRYWAVLAVLCAAATAHAGETQTPALGWTPRSDWVNVRSLGAVGDGRADDTAAIQKALDAARNGTTIYLPAGTYRVTTGLRLTGPLVGFSMIGHGRDTTLLWDGEKGGALYTDDGVAHSRYIGVSFDGRGTAGIGFHHASHKRFETEVIHRHLAFRGFTNAAVLAEPEDKFALAETEFRNCLFEDSRRGVVFVSFNDYNFTFTGCAFRRCGTGIECRHGNTYVRNTHFSGSTETDMLLAPEHASSVRRCTSVGSRAFLRYASAVSPLVLQDCHVARWTGGESPVRLAGAPVAMFDCSFTPGEADAPPLRLARKDQRLILSRNRSAGRELVLPGTPPHVHVVPGGERTGALADANRTFLSDVSDDVPGRVFDVRRDFGAVGDGRTDDTAALQKAIDAARAHGRDAIAYLPTGKYAISRTLRMTGANYRVGGTGFLAQLVWRGAEGGTMVAVHDPRDVTLEFLSVGQHDGGKMNNGTDILQTGSGAPSRMTYDGVFVYGMYQRKPLTKGLVFRGLGREATVVAPHVQGNLRLIDSAAATFLFDCSYEGSVVVEGKGGRRGGLLGFLTRLSTITTHGLYVRDSHSVVMSDLYVEQADDGFVLTGAEGDPRGRVTIQGAKVDFGAGGKHRDGTVLDIRNYAGSVYFGPDQFYASLPRVPIRQRGDIRTDVYLWGNCFYKTHLEVDGGKGLRVHLLGNEGVAVEGKDRVLSHENRAADNMAPGEMGRLAPALDDLRRLGALDLRINCGK